MYEKFFGNVKGVFNIITLVEICLSILLIMVGLTFFTSSKSIDFISSIVIGGCLMFTGISSIFSYLKREDIILFNNNLIYGIILIILGFLTMFLGKFLSILLSIYFIFKGLQMINYSYFLKKFNESCWLFNFAVGIMYIAISVATFLTSSENIIKVSGICILGYGVINLIDFLLFRKRSKYFIA